MRQFCVSFCAFSLLFVLAACQPVMPVEPTATDVRNSVMDPAQVMDAYTAAINAHDVEAALALVADDAVYERPTGQFSGHDEIRGFIEGLIARDVKVELIGDRRVEGEHVYWTSHVTLANAQDATAAPVELMNNSESVVRDGKIVMHTATRAQQ